MSAKEMTPMMRQYESIKREHEDCILFYRLGDFYEMFNEDAITASKELDLVLTSRDRGKNKDDGDRVPMCGVPYHSVDAYIARLMAKGYKVAICEQTEDPATAKGLVERAVTHIVTPGTIMDTAMLEEDKSNYLASVYIDTQGAAACFADISTGEISVASFPPDCDRHIVNELARFSPSEVILNGGASQDSAIREFVSDKLNCLIMSNADDRFDFMQATMRICEQFEKVSVDELEIGSDHAAVCAVGGILSYIAETQKTVLRHMNALDYYSEGKFMELDLQTTRNLEIVRNMRTLEKKGSLLWVLDKTKTPMGGRMLRSWILKPLLSAAAIKRRQTAVNVLFENAVIRNELMASLGYIGDMERLIAKVVYGTVNGRDLRSLEDYVNQIPAILSQLGRLENCGNLLSDIGKMDDLSDISELISVSIAPEPPFSIREGGVIRDGYNAEVDRLRALLGGSSEAMLRIEEKERARTGKKLRVGYNRVAGYYIEIPRSQSDDVPDDYIRRQTLTNNERFITSELKELETELLSAGDKLQELESRVFGEIRQAIADKFERVKQTAERIAALDTLCALAETASRNNYCMPEIDMGDALEIVDGRHPVVEAMQRDSLFVPNDVYLDGGENIGAIITGPNMAGKSTYMRQTAIIVLMAQIGSFVPAKSAHIGIVDRVFTRIGASDDLTAGKSTFMMEMSEVAEILRSATSKSLLILDEIGRGTSTYDGMSIARAVLEHCVDKRRLGAKTMFATHYHELTVLENELNGVKNFNISAKKRGGDIIFLRKIVPGGADESYGVEVAGLAGVPNAVIKRAKEILSSLEADTAPCSPKKRPDDGGQMTMTDLSAQEIKNDILNLNIDTMTPIEAMNVLYELKKKVRG